MIAPIRCRGTFHLYAARVQTTGAPRVLVVIAPDADRARAARCLDAFAAAHERLAGGMLPAVAERGDGFVALDCDAVCDLEALLDRVAERRATCAYAKGSAFTRELLGTLRRAHGANTFVGALGPANFLVGPRGDVWLIGFGHNIALLGVGGVPSGAPAVALAPEVGAGAAATAGADLFAATLFIRSLMRFVDLPRALMRVHQGRPLPEDKELVDVLVWSNLAILAGHPDRRPTDDDAIAAMEHAWRVIGVRPDPCGWARFVAEHVAALPPPGRLVVDSDGRWVESLGGKRHDLGARRSLRRILLAFLRRHLDSPGGTLTLDELLGAGWPNERPLFEAGANRVYVALSTLRRMGFDDLLERHDGGWRIAPGTALQVVDG